LCLCIQASTRIPRYDLGRQTPHFQGGSVIIVVAINLDVMDLHAGPTVGTNCHDL
jgi:hypothetical protein